jgi:hypothetical protein
MEKFEVVLFRVGFFLAAVLTGEYRNFPETGFMRPKTCPTVEAFC